MRDDLIFDTHYGYWFDLLCERFYRHVDVVLNIVQLVGGSSAAAGAMSGNAMLVVASGVALALCAALSLTIQPAIKAERHERHKQVWLDLKGRMLGIDDDALAAAVAQAQAGGSAGIGALGTPAFNATLRATGRKADMVAVSWWQRVAAALA